MDKWDSEDHVEKEMGFIDVDLDTLFRADQCLRADILAYVKECRRECPLSVKRQWSAEQRCQYEFFKACLRAHVPADDLWHDSGQVSGWDPLSGWDRFYYWLTFISNPQGIVAAWDVWGPKRCRRKFLLTEDEWLLLPFWKYGCNFMHPHHVRNRLSIQMFLIKPLDPLEWDWCIAPYRGEPPPIALLTDHIKERYPRVNLQRCRLVLRFIHWNETMEDLATTDIEPPVDQPFANSETFVQREKNVMMGIYEWTGKRMKWLFYRDFFQHQVHFRLDPFGNFMEPPRDTAYREPRPRYSVEFRDPTLVFGWDWLRWFELGGWQTYRLSARMRSRRSDG